LGAPKRPRDAPKHPIARAQSRPAKSERPDLRRIGISRNLRSIPKMNGVRNALSFRTLRDHVIVFSEAGLYRHLREFVDYYHRSPTHLGLQKDTPEPRPVQAPEAGRIVAIPEVGGLHHRYERRAA